MARISEKLLRTRVEIMMSAIYRVKGELKHFQKQVPIT